MRSRSHTAARTAALLASLAATALAGPALGQDDAEDEAEDQPIMSKGAFSGLKFRSVGPALMSGRIGDFAMNPDRPAEYYVAVCSGGLWKTVNNGVTYEPIFDGEGSYSIGCVTLDPNDPSVVWVGTGENNSQRSVSFGDGVYKSVDGGKNWKNVGLKDSEHIGMIAIDPRDSDRVFVAAQGPLWRSGDERGLYLTEDGGETWTKVLDISEHTGVNEVHIDPEDPDVMYASAYQRQRKVWTLINGGPESGVWKSTDGGHTWREINKGLPGVDKGRIGLDISPVDHNVLYAVVEAAEGKDGFYRSTNRGETWEKMSGYVAGSPQYYNEIVASPHDVDTVYAMDTYMHVTRDGGKNFSRVPKNDKHVDNHALWIDPTDPQHMIVGCDGGIYETWDDAANWHFKANLPVTQFYRVSVDMDEPFYNIYGGTQDNNSQGGPSRTTRLDGIANEDWYITVGGDGYETVVDPTNADVVYSQWQYGGLVRYDRASGEITDIRPVEKPGDEPYVFNWDTPLIMSPHSNERLYFAGNFLFRTDDGGMSWDIVSPNLTRGLDRNELEVMGEIQKPDAVAKHVSTSIYGNAVALDESPVKEGLLYVGTDDGLIHISENAGRSWRKLESEDVGDVPELTYVSCLHASPLDESVVFATFDNHKQGDFKPYVYRSDDKGRTWKNIAGDLPERDVVYAIRQDHADPDLLFVGTEFGCYFTVDGGEHWVRMSGVPTIAVKDLEIQRRENDVVLGTFGRGFYVLDDYTPLRDVSEEILEADATLFDVKDAPLYVQWSRLGSNNGRGSQGASYYTAPNPPFGAVFTYHLGEKIQTLTEVRKEAEKEEGWEYPSVDDSRAEDLEIEPTVVLTVRDDEGNVVNRVTGSRSKGFHRVAWNLRYPYEGPTSLSSGSIPDWAMPSRGPLVAPGTYSVTLDLKKDETFERLAGPETFEVVALDLATFASADPAADLAFHQEAAALNRAVAGAGRAIGEAENRVNYLRQAILDTPAANESHLQRLDKIRLELTEMRTALYGDRTISRRQEAQSPGISSRIGGVIEGMTDVTSPPTETWRQQYRYARDAYTQLQKDLHRVVGKDLVKLEEDLEKLGAPWTPGRLPNYQP